MLRKLNNPGRLPRWPKPGRRKNDAVRPHRRTGGRMLRRMTAGVLLVASVPCPSLTPSADCSGSACPDGQTCDATTQLCVLDLGPQITVLSPKPDAAVKDPALEGRGTVTTGADSTLAGRSYQLGV